MKDEDTYGKKWPEMVLEQLFKSNIHFRSVFRLNELAVIEILNRLYCSNVDLGSHEPVTYLGSKVKPISTPTSHTQTSTQTSQDNIRHVCLARD